MEVEMLAVIPEHLGLLHRGEAISEEPDGPPQLFVLHEGDALQEIFRLSLEVSSLGGDPWMLVHLCTSMTDDRLITLSAASYQQ
jgi:hypothetical protein